MTQETTIKFSRILFLSLSVVLIVYLIWQNFSPLGSQTIVFDLKNNKFISKLNPSTRINDPVCDESQCTQTMFEDPVYFDLLLARNFNSLKIDLTYQAKSPIDIRIGMQTKEGWNYTIKNKKSISKSNGWQTADYYFPLSAAWKNKRHVNFLISAPEIKDNDKEIIIKELKFELQR